MKLEAFKMALGLAAEDEALAAAIESSDSIALSMAEDGSVTFEAGGESVVIDASALMGEDEGEMEMEVEVSG